MLSYNGDEGRYMFAGSIYRKCRRIVTSSFYNFFEDDCYTKSATLTYYTLQSIVPFLAFLLGIAKGFGFDEYLTQLIEHLFEEQREAASYALSIATSLLKHIKGEYIIGFGILFLIWTVITLLSYIELVLHEIWKIKEQRSLFRKFGDYIAIVVICPLILIASSSFTVFLKTRLAELHGVLIEKIGGFLLLGVKLAPWLLGWFLFSILYFLIPSTKLRIWPRLIAAIIAGTIFQLWQLFYINFQIQIFNYNVVYGTLAVLPLLLIWLQVSWLIGLAGAELAASIENVLYYEEDHTGFQESIGRKQLGLLILQLCLKPFYTGHTPVTDVQLTKKLKIPLNITRKMLDILINGEVLVPVDLKDGSIGYHPFADPAHLYIKDVCDIIERSSDFEIKIAASEPVKKMSGLLKQLDEAEKESEGNVKLSDLYNALNT